MIKQHDARTQAESQTTTVPARAMPGDTFRLLFSKREAARALAISLRKVDYLISEGKLKTTRIGRRCLVHRNELERFARTAGV
jgi:excisionase family DNA binding protein